jgi:hypothetical protein
VNDRQARLSGDPLPWLLEEENPSVRYRALIDLVGHTPGDTEARAARAAIARLPLVQELLAAQHPDGHWGDDAAKPYTAQGTLGVLGILRTLAVPPDERTAAGCDSLLRHCQHESGGFSMTRARRSGIFPCTTGEHLPLLVYFGIEDDPRLRRAFEFVVEQACDDGGLDCGRYAHRDCLWGAIAALNGLAVLPAGLRSPRSERGVQRMAGALLDAAYDFEGEHKRWLTFGVPRGWDLLSALRALAAHGCARDPRFAPLLDVFLSRQDNRGRWTCGSVSRTWPLEKRNRPGKWVTLDALRLLRALETGV